MIRYLLHTSYIGTQFKGVNMLDKFYQFGDPRMIQGVLERVVRSVTKTKCPIGYAGRTDARVHATSTYFHIDYTQHNCSPLDTDTLLQSLNTQLMRFDAPIRINSIETVDANIFEAHRNIKRRGYLYRIAVRKPSVEGSNSVAFPIEEVDRCYFIDSADFDIERMRQAASMLVGKHDFRSFMKWSREAKTQRAAYGQRSMLSLRVEPGRPGVTAHNLPMCDKHFHFYDIKFKGLGFIYRQIRRMVGVLCAVADGRLTQKHVYEMLTIPSHQMWYDLKSDGLVDEAPARGLYLSRISYYPSEEWTLNVNKTPRGMRMRSFVSPNKHGI